MEIQFVKVSPNQNMTLLIETPIAREKQLEIAKTLIAYHSVYAEQAKNKKALARLQMMAGEFCGNATLALATYLFAKEQPPAFSKKIIPLEVSGADDIVYPEKQLAVWTAIRYSADHISDYIELDEEHAIFEILIPKDWIGKTVGELDIRNKHNINIMAFKCDGIMNLSIRSDTEIPAHDTMLVLGNIRDIQKCFHI